jgi:Transglycosylase SLT domain
MPAPRRPSARAPADLRRRRLRARRLRAAAALGLAVLAGIGLALLLHGGGPGGGERLRPGSGAGHGADPLRYDPAGRAAFQARAAAGLAHVLYAKSPGGAVASARRTARWRPLVDAAARRARLDPDELEAIVLLESAGRPDAMASDDLDGAAGLTQILAETARNLLGMRVDVRASERLTRGIARGHRVAARERERRRVDERFDPAKALAATARYLVLARRALGRDDLAVVSYHMGIGNLQQALAAYGGGRVPYAQLFFDSSPLHHPKAWAKLASLGDDSATYLWRVRAAQRIMRAYRADPVALAATAALQTARNSAELVLRPPGQTPAFAGAAAIRRATAAGGLLALHDRSLAPYGLRIDPSMGELGPRLGATAATYRVLRPEALAVARWLGAGAQAISGTGPLILTSATRDTRYQRALARGNPEATHAFSVHTTGFAFDVRRAYASPAQAQAFQFLLDRLTALDVIAWVREPAAIHVTAGPRARDLLELLAPGAPRP